MTATELSKILGVSKATLYRLKRQWPGQAPKSFDIATLEKWRSFCLMYVTDPDAICRLARVHG